MTILSRMSDQKISEASDQVVSNGQIVSTVCLGYLL